jgi:molecular chaperone GrpE
MMSNDNENADAANNDPAGAPAGETVTDEAIAALIDEQQAAQDQQATYEDSNHEPSLEPISEEAVVAIIAERDDYLDQLQRAKAEFANARRRSDERAAQQRAQAAASLVEKLLPVLDSCEIALGQGIEEIRPISDALFDVLAAQGLERVEAAGEPFDPELHEAVMYEEGEGEQVVVETLRTGYRWNDRVLRAAMVKVQG